MSKKKDFVLDALNVVSWIVFIGLCIEAGALIFNFIFAVFKPVGAQNIYKGLDLSNLYQNNFNQFVTVMSFVVVLAILKAYIFYFVVNIFMKLNLVKPFSAEIAKLIEKISYEAFSIAIVSLIAQKYTEMFINNGFEVSSIESYWGDAGAFLMMAGVVYVISKIFNKGIELQKESELTI